MKRILPLLLLAFAVSARADGAWTKYPLSHQAPYPAALVGRPANLARFAQTTFTTEGNTRTGWQDAAWRSPMSLVTTGVSPGFEFVFAAPDGRPLANVATGLRIRFGYAENFYVGLPEIEILGDLASKATTMILVK